MLARSLGKVALEPLMQTSGSSRNFQLKSREYTVRAAAAGVAQHARTAIKTMAWIMMLKMLQLSLIHEYKGP
jgi:hypothetical protein